MQCGADETPLFGALFVALLLLCDGVAREAEATGHGAAPPRGRGLVGAGGPGGVVTTRPLVAGVYVWCTEHGEGCPS